MKTKYITRFLILIIMFSGIAQENIIQSETYDITGKTISKSISYFDDLGKSLQSQSLDIKTNKVWATHTLYDDQGRPALTTLGAPIGNNFGYKPNFLSIPNLGSLNTDPSSVSVQENTLGWYYSENNTSEPNQDITSRPYTRMVYSELNPGTPLKIIGGNKMDNEWKNTYSFSMPAGQELTQPVAFGHAKYDTNTYHIIKTVTRDVHGIENVVFTDTDGRTLAAARSGNEQGNTTARPSSVSIGKQGFVDVHIPVGEIGIKISVNNGTILKVFDLITEEKLTIPLGNLTNGFYRIAVEDLSTYIANSITVTYPENYYDYSLNEYDDAGRIVTSYQPLGKLKSEFKYNSLGQLLYTKSPDEGEAWFKYRRDGQIRFSQNSKQQAVSEFSYTHYDSIGRPVESGVHPETLQYSFRGNSEIPLEDILENTYTYDQYNNNRGDFQNSREQHFTLYDREDQIGIQTAFGDDPRIDNYQNQSFIAGNVSKTHNLNPSTTTTWYSYDIYGRVKWIVQNIEGLGIKTIDYEYDDVTSQVNKVYYQKGDSDEFIHRYTYNMDDYSLTKVETSTNDRDYTEHAVYEYYETGALKQLNLAQGLQKIDYIYNLNGALKSINHPNLTEGSEQGTNTDLFGMNIHYYNGDYTRNPTLSNSNGVEQYNGNIKSITWNSKNLNNGNPDTYHYTYNKNNWLTGASFNQNVEEIDTTIKSTEIRNQLLTNSENVQAKQKISLRPGFKIVAASGYKFNAKITNKEKVQENGDYNVSGITYDQNGNIKTLNRNKNTTNGSNTMDKLSYTYKTDKPNQLLRVDDAVGDVAGADDIGDQNGNNYVYNNIGQLIENKTDNISYFYNASGLVTEIKKANKPVVKFFYNDKNHRVKKESYNLSNENLLYTEYYVRDVSGTAMAIYRKDQNGINLEENTVYGAGRLGVRKSDNSFLYQLTDHLGNVRGVVARNNGVALLAATDYYPFGMPMPNRNLKGDYRYAYQGQEIDPETGKEAFQLRLWDSRIGRWLTTDPYGQYNSPYLGMGNNPMNGTDPDGGYWYQQLDENGEDVGDVVWFDEHLDIQGYVNLGLNYSEQNIDGEGLNRFYDGETQSSYTGYGVANLENYEFEKSYENSNWLLQKVENFANPFASALQVLTKNIVHGTHYGASAFVQEVKGMDATSSSLRGFEPILNPTVVSVVRNGVLLHVDTHSKGDKEFAKSYSTDIISVTRLKAFSNTIFNSIVISKAKKFINEVIDGL